MRRYFFHLATPCGYELDDSGVEFDSPEAAYLDASQAAIELSIEALRRRESTAGHRFEIMDDGGQLLFDLHFSEMLRRDRAVSAPSNAPLRLQLDAGVRRGQDLQRELKAGFAEVLQKIQTAQALLAIHA